MALFNVALLRQHGRLLLRVRALEAHPNVADRPATVSTPTPAPALRLERLNGGQATLGAFPPGNHQKVLLIFTDPGCGPCQVLVPELVEWQSRPGSDLAIVPVARADANTGRSAYSSLGLDHILLDPSGQAAKAYGAEGFPTAILITADGRVARPVVASTRSSSSSPASSRIAPAAIQEMAITRRRRRSAPRRRGSRLAIQHQCGRTANSALPETVASHGSGICGLIS